jgi:hypothetical protein
MYEACRQRNAEGIIVRHGIMIAMLVLSLTAPSAVPVRAQQTHSSIVVGSDGAWEALRFDDATRYGDLLILFGDPVVRNLIPFAVLNDSTKTVHSLRFAIHSRWVRGEVSDDDARVYPLELAPHGVGFGVASFGYGFADEREAIKVSVLPAADTATMRDLRIAEVSVLGSGRYRQLNGTLDNPNPEDVQRVEVHMLCLTASGVITNYRSEVLGLPQLHAGGTTDFNVLLPDDCGGLFLATAVAHVAGQAPG